MCEEKERQRDLSYNAARNKSPRINISFILDTLNSNRAAAIKQFIDFTQKANADQFMDLAMKERRSDEDLARKIKELLNGQSAGILQSLDIDKRNKIIKQIKEIEGVTQRQIARVTGLHQSIIFKV